MSMTALWGDNLLRYSTTLFITELGLNCKLSNMICKICQTCSTGFKSGEFRFNLPSRNQANVVGTTTARRTEYSLRLYGWKTPTAENNSVKFCKSASRKSVLDMPRPLFHMNTNTPYSVTQFWNSKIYLTIQNGLW